MNLIDVVLCCAVSISDLKRVTFLLVGFDSKLRSNPTSIDDFFDKNFHISECMRLIHSEKLLVIQFLSFFVRQVMSGSAYERYREITRV